MGATLSFKSLKFFPLTLPVLVLGAKAGKSRPILARAGAGVSLVKIDPAPQPW